MKNKKIVVIAAVTMLVIGILTLIPQITLLTARLQERGSVAKEQATTKSCNGTTSICIIQSGKIITKPITSADEQYMQRQYTTQKDQHVQYAVNVAAAVSAIRAYTHIPNLNLALLSTNAPTHISYYCSPDNKCWAVDNQTHQVVPNGK